MAMCRGASSCSAARRAKWSDRACYRCCSPTRASGNRSGCLLRGKNAVGGEMDPDRCAEIPGAGDFEPAAMELDQTAGDRQAEAGTLEFLSQRVLDLTERLESDGDLLV